MLEHAIVKSSMVVVMGTKESDRKRFEHLYRPVDSKTITSLIFADEKYSIKQKKSAHPVRVIRP